MREILGGSWYAADIQDVMATGKDAMTWKGHMVVGWDAGVKAYKGFSVDNMGIAAAYSGTMDGDKFTLETDQPMSEMGQTFKDRLTWLLNSDGTAAFSDEHQLQGSTDWVKFETGTIRWSGSKSSAKSKKKMM